MPSAGSSGAGGRQQHQIKAAVVASRMSDCVRSHGIDYLVIQIPGNIRQLCAAENCTAAGRTTLASMVFGLCIPCFFTSQRSCLSIDL
jgi:hypothetical protein